MKDKTIRSHTKWAKISGDCKKGYSIALGYKNELKAFSITTTKKLTHADIIATNWLNNY